MTEVQAKTRTPLQIADEVVAAAQRDFDLAQSAHRTHVSDFAMVQAQLASPVGITPELISQKTALEVTIRANQRVDPNNRT